MMEKIDMSRPHPLTAMKEWEWSRSWEEQQAIVERLHAKRGSWLPNVVEPRQWGVLRWTSGRPVHAATTGQAVAETFVVLRPGITDVAVRDRVVASLREPAPAVRILGIGLRRHQLTGMIPGAIAGAVVFAALGAVLGSVAGAIVGAVLGALVGAVAGAMVGQYRFERERAAVLRDEQQVRVVTGRYAPTSWTRLVKATTGLERAINDMSEPDTQAAEAAQTALWEAAGLLLRSSDHTGVDVLADGMERLAQAHRG